MDFTKLFTNKIKKAFEKKEGPNKKIYAVMRFNTETELGISNKPYEWTNSGNTITTDGATAILTYRNIKNGIGKIIDALSFEELNTKMNQMIKSFKNPFYVTKELEGIYSSYGREL